MLVKDIIVLALDFCHEDELASLMRGEETNLNDEEQAKIESLTRCFNLVYEEVASQYIPFIKCQKVATVDGRVEYSDLQGKVIDIVEVKNSHDRRIRFRKFSDYLIALANEVTVWYKSLPSALLINDEFSSTLPERVFAYGVAREYFYSIGVNDEGDIYDNRFKDSLLVLLGKSKEIVMPARGWF